MPAKKAKLQIPPTATKRVWIGSYGGHFGVVVVFGKKPGKFKTQSYDIEANKGAVAGVFDADTFNRWFGTNIQATTNKIVKVTEYDLTGVWDEEGRIVGLNTFCD